MDPKAWTKAIKPILSKNPAGAVYAPRPNGFFQRADGSTRTVSHANSGPEMGCNK